MQPSLSHYIALLAVAALAASPLAAPAASNGLAWDSVTKLNQASDPASVQPGSFEDDYAAAAALQASGDAGGGGFLAKARAAEAAARAAMEIAQTGLAEKHYVAGKKERTDAVAYGTATIRDCAARTITTLNLRKKTYKVASMDHPAGASGAPSQGGEAKAPSDDGTRVALDVKNTALGTKQFGGQTTQGYRSAIKMTTTKPSGESQSANIDMLAYYTNFDQPVVLCSTLGGFAAHQSGMSNQAQGTMMMSAYSNVLKMMVNPLSKRISITQSGPALQAGRLAAFDAVTFSGEHAGRGGTFVGERGHFRTIQDSDPVFSVPSDFTKEQ